MIRPAASPARPRARPRPRQVEDLFKEKKSTKRKRKTYTVKSGDTLSGIAEKTNVSLETLRDLNPKADTLSPGQKLKLSR